jgi:glycosyltransferase involved in cell wall biosynthesis
MSVVIFLATFNGERFLEEQLASFKAQAYRDWKLIVSDDGSTDKTMEILKSFRKANPNKVIDIRKGPQKGFVRNFLHMLRDYEPDAKYFAFSDQDDIWVPEKLFRAIRMLDNCDYSPSLYCGRTVIIDHAGQRQGLSPLVTLSPSFGNALVQSIAGGNTMVFNRSAWAKLRETPEVTPVSHDWWAYQVISGVGGNIIYDPTPSVLYRQHEANIIGSSTSIKAKISRLKRLVNGDYANWNERTINSLAPFISGFTSQNQEIFLTFMRLRSPRLKERIAALHRGSIFRRNTHENLALALSILLKKF